MDNNKQNDERCQRLRVRKVTSTTLNTPSAAAGDTNHVQSIVLHTVPQIAQQVDGSPASTDANVNADHKYLSAPS